MADRGGPPLGLRVLFGAVEGGRGGRGGGGGEAGGGSIRSFDRLWPLCHTSLAEFAMSDINIYHISHFREQDNS